MKRTVLTLLLTCIALLCNAQQAAIRDIDIHAVLHDNGSATITEKWDVTAVSGTEWYVVFGNIKDQATGKIMTLTLDSVSDETGAQYRNIGSWDVQRTIEEKAGQCGLIDKGIDGGYEICWGIGSYGNHVFTLTYTVDNLLGGYSDYDGFNHMFVARKLSTRPEHVRVVIDKPGTIFAKNDSVKIGAFGFAGHFDIVNGQIVVETTEPIQNDGAVIVMVRFAKGFFEPTWSTDESFSIIEDRALEGSDYTEEETDMQQTDDWWAAYVVCGLLLLSLLSKFYNGKGSKIKKKRMLLGMRERNVPWCRDIPYDGDLYAAYALLQDTGSTSRKNTIVAAMILRMISDNIIAVRPNANGRSINITFNSAEKLDDTNMRKLYTMLEKAAGGDHILQEKEFKSWSKHNAEVIYNWSQAILTEGHSGLARWALKHAAPKTDPKALKQMRRQGARETFGLKNFLSDVTLINERRTTEVSLWSDYLVYGALFGIADKVAKELKEFHPNTLNTLMNSNLDDMNVMDIFTILAITDSISDSITSGISRGTPSSNDSSNWSFGDGGMTSLGGGGGFSGGGIGGGSR